VWLNWLLLVSDDFCCCCRRGGFVLQRPCPKWLSPTSTNRPVTFEDFCNTFHMISQMPSIYGKWKMDFLGTPIRTAAEQKIFCLDAKGLWKPRRNFTLAVFTLTLSYSVLCGTGQNYDKFRLRTSPPAQLRWSSSRLQPIKIQPYQDSKSTNNVAKTLNHYKKIMKLSRSAWQENLVNRFSSASQRFNFNLHETLNNVCASAVRSTQLM